MPLPNILEFIGNNVTQAEFKAAQEKLLNFLSGEAATKVELSAAVTPKADKTYVDTALASFQNGAIKTYPTLSAANADIANIALNTKVSVLSETDGGDYYKASASATSLTKSPYDPINIAKAYTDSLIYTEIDINLLYKQGYTLNLQGEEIAINASWNVSGFIEVDNSNIKYQIQTFHNATTPRIGIAEYDENKVFLRSRLTPTSTSTTTFTGEITTTSDAAYVRFGFYTANQIDSATINQMYASEIFENNVSSIAKTVATEQITDVLTSDDILTLTTLTTGVVINKNGGTSVASSNWSTTDFINVIEGQSIEYALQSVISSSLLTSIINGYDNSGSFVKTLVVPTTDTVSTHTGKITIPSGVHKIRVSFYTLNGIYSLNSNIILSTQKFKDAVNSVVNTSSRYNGKVLMTLGDSITDHHTNPNTYPPLVANALGMTLIDGARSGRRIRDAFIRTTIITDDTIKSANIITIAHGTNDFKLETDLGAISDTPTVSSLFFDATYTATTNQTDGSFYADYKGVIERILSINPQVRIMLISPIRRTQAAATGTDTNAKGYKLKAYADAVKEVAEYYALPFLDNYNHSGFNSINIPVLTLNNDGLHPNNWAQANIMTPKILGFILAN